MLGPGRQYARRISLVFSVKLEFCLILYMTCGGSEPSLLVWKITPVGSGEAESLVALQEMATPASPQ